MILRLGHVRAALIVAPHPDDEVIGAFGLIRRLRAAGAALTVIVVTDGAASHPASERWPRARLIRERRRETLRAMRRLGVTRGGIRFLGLPDGRLPDGARACRDGLGRAARRVARLDLLVGPAIDDDHGDHRCVAEALRATRLPGARRLSFKVWPADCRARRGRALLLGPATRLAKRHAIRGYRTQTGLIADDPAGFAISGRQLAAFSRPRELFREAR